MLNLTNPFAPPQLDGFDLNVNPYTQFFIPSAPREGAAEPRHENLPLIFGPALQTMRGRWREELSVNASAPISRMVVEIGCLFGKTLSALAKDHPEVGFIGFDITFKRVVKSAKALVREGASNGKVALCNGRSLAEVFAPGELDGVILFFPDPWNKKRKQKHRLVNDQFLQALLTTLKPGGFFWFKTDQLNYFEHAVTSMAAAQSWGVADASQRQEHSIFQPGKYSSSFEEYFSSLGQTYYEQVWLKGLI